MLHILYEVIKVFTHLIKNNNMDLNEIKNRLAKLNNKGGGGSSDFKNNFWRPPVGEKS